MLLKLMWLQGMRESKKNTVWEGKEVSSYGVWSDLLPVFAWAVRLGMI